MKRLIKTKYILQFILIILVLVSFFRPFLSIYEKRNSLFLGGYTQRYEILRKAYYNSQYVNKINPGIMPDETLESFMGGAFIRGVNPILLVHDQPPLGRYIIGLSIILFDNPATLIIPLMLITTIGIYLISRIILGNSVLCLIPVAIFANEPLFLSKFEYAPLLEPIQLTFVVLALYFFINGAMKKNYGRYFLLCSISLGFVISTRFFILGAVLVFSMLLFFLLKRNFDKRFFNFIFLLPLSLVVLISSYTRTIQEGYSIIKIFGIQKYIYTYHQSQLNSSFSFWDLIMFNKWHTWWGDRRILTDSEWFVFWPISIVSTGLRILLSIIKKLNLSDPEKIIILWIICYCALLSIGLSTTRYFLPLVPFLYIILTSLVIKIGKIFYK